MGDRNRGHGNQQKGDKKKGGEKLIVRRNKAWTWPKNRARNLLREANRTERKLKKLLARSRRGLPGGILPASDRSERLYDHIRNLKAQTKTFPDWL